jgi:phosphoribosylanthranilate isomerase
VRPLLQIAGVHDIDEALMSAAAGVTHIGIPLRLPVHKEDVSEEEAAQIFNALPEHVQGVVITYENEPDALVELMGITGAQVLQIHGDISLQALQELRRLLPNNPLFKSIVIGKVSFKESLETALGQAEHVDAFLTDTYDPGTGAEGATGKTHDWKRSRRLVAALAPTPLILAGGLHPGNVYDAVRFVGPAGVDAHTGLEDKNGRKDKALVEAFVAESLRAFCADLPAET